MAVEKSAVLPDAGGSNSAAPTVQSGGKPMGPWIETDVDLDGMETIVRVNGKESNRFRTKDMIFGIKPFIVELTKYFTLWPGDVIWMGTDGASPDLSDGDVVDIEITGIGTLRNRFVKETAPGSRDL